VPFLRKVKAKIIVITAYMWADMTIILYLYCVLLTNYSQTMRRSTRIYSPLGLFITTEREALGVTVKEFCRLAGISSRTYAKLLFEKTCMHPVI
jgi:hypothetical protein